MGESVSWKGHVLEVREGNRLVCALCVDENNRDARLLLLNGRETSVRRRRVCHVSAAAVAGWRDRSAAQEALRRCDARRRAVAEEYTRGPIDELWELLRDEGGVVSLSELASFLGDIAPGSDEEAALLRALETEGISFRPDKGGYRPNPPDRVAELKAHAAAARRREEQQARLESALETLLRDGYPAAPTPAMVDLIERVREVALRGEASRHARQVRQLLDKAGLRGETAAFEALVRIGLFDEDENLAFLIHDIETDFPAEAHEAVDELIERGFDPEAFLAETPARLDLRGLHTITIDDASTRDIDDALSIEVLDGGRLRVSVHVTYVAHFIPPDSALDRIARRRATSIYVPEGTVPMLPEAFSTDLGSLVQGRPRPALTLRLTFDEASRLIDGELAVAVVEVDERLTYDEVDAAIADRGAFQLLEGLARARYEERMRRGAVAFDYPSLRIRIDGDGRVHLERYSEKGPAHRIVSEFMILTNAMVADYCHREGIPAVFRCQGEPNEQVYELAPSLDADAQGFDPVLAYRMRRLIGPTANSLTAAPHHGLGVDAYVQFTSPVRRYRDLLLQQQVGSILDGRGPAFDDEALRARIVGLDEREAHASQAARQRRTYWLYKALAQWQGKTTPAVVVDARGSSCVVYLKEVLMEARCPNPGGQLVVGDELHVRIVRVSPRRSQVTLAPVGF